jgi:signal transduction histidine kinase
MENKEVVLEKKKIALNDLIAGVADDLRILAEQKEVRLAYQAGESVTLTADPVHLRRALVNLVDNAIKYTPSGGTVNIRQEAVADKVRISIIDTGAGIPAPELTNIFHRFYRSTGSKADLGFGLGLSIAQSIINAHQGTIEVNSTVGKGSTFSVILPS